MSVKNILMQIFKFEFWNYRYSYLKMSHWYATNTETFCRKITLYRFVFLQINKNFVWTQLYFNDNFIHTLCINKLKIAAICLCIKTIAMHSMVIECILSILRVNPYVWHWNTHLASFGYMSHLTSYPQSWIVYLICQ